MRAMDKLDNRTGTLGLKFQFTNLGRYIKMVEHAAIVIKIVRPISTHHVMVFQLPERDRS